jgi:hypothetical protein
VGGGRIERNKWWDGWYLKLRIWQVAILLSGVAVAQNSKSPDGDLLEFLGSVDSEGPGWSEYLERTDVSKVAKQSPGTTPTDPVSSPTPKPAPKGTGT